MLTIGQKVFYGRYREPGTVTAVYNGGALAAIWLDTGRAIITSADQIHTTQEEN